MSDLPKKIAAYRLFTEGDWRNNFKHLDVTNVESSLKSILNKQELVKTYSRLGVHDGATSYRRLISQDEMIFRIMVLMDTQLERIRDELATKTTV